jgi:hypothetical protein
MSTLPATSYPPRIQIHLSGSIPSDLLCTIEEMGEQVATPFQAAVMAWLKARGIAAAKAHEWETPGEICARLHISRPHLRRSLEHRDCPAPLDIMRGPSTRIRYLRSHAPLDTFLTRHLNKS